VTEDQNPAQDAAVEPQGLPDNVVSMSAHVVARSGLLKPPTEPEPVQEPAEDAQDSNEAQPTRPTLRALTPPEVAALVAQCTRSGSARTRRASARTLGKQVADLQNALLNFRAAVQRGLANMVSVQDAALAVLRVANPQGGEGVPHTLGEMRVMAEVKAQLALPPEVEAEDETPAEDATMNPVCGTPQP